MDLNWANQRLFETVSLSLSLSTSEMRPVNINVPLDKHIADYRG